MNCIFYNLVCEHNKINYPHRTSQEKLVTHEPAAPELIRSDKGLTLETSPF